MMALLCSCRQKKGDLHNFLTFMNKPDDPEHQQQQKKLHFHKWINGNIYFVSHLHSFYRRSQLRQTNWTSKSPINIHSRYQCRRNKKKNNKITWQGLPINKIRSFFAHFLKLPWIIISRVYICFYMIPFECWK